MNTVYGPGAPGFGLLSIVFVAVLVIWLGVAACIAHFPEVFLAMGRWFSSKGAVRSAGKHLNRGVDVVARKLSIDAAAAASLLVGLAIVALLSAGFAELLDGVLDGELMVLVDQPVAQWAASHRDLWLTHVLKICTYLGKGIALTIIVTVLCVAVARRVRSRLPIILGAAGLGGVGIILVAAKAVVGRSRPASIYALTTENGYSFPSGHATGSTATAVLCAWILTYWVVKRWIARVAVWTFALTCAGVIGFSRVYLGVHFFSDVVAGAMLGAAWAGTVMMIGTWWEHSRRYLASAQSAPTPGGGVHSQAQAGGGQYRDGIHGPGDAGAGDKDAPERQ